MPLLLRVNVYIVISVYLIKNVNLKKMYVYIHDILVLQYVSSRRPSDIGSIVTNCSCTLLIIGHTEPKTVSVL